MMYKEGEKVVLKVDKPAVSERLFGRKGEIFEIYEVDPYDDYCYGLVNDRGVFFWVRAEDIEKHDPDKLTIKHPFELYDLPYTLREIVSRIDELAEALKTMNEKIDEMNEGKDVEVTFDKDELVIKPKFKEKIEAIWEKPSTVPPSTAKLHTGEVIVPHSSSYRGLDTKPNNKMRKELIEEAKKKVELTIERREQHLYENISFHVNPTKRVVVCIIKEDDGEIIGKGIAKCAPEDVFNRSLGEFISLRRACGLTNYEMESKFLNPVQPDKLVKGVVVSSGFPTGKGKYDEWEDDTVVEVKDGKAFYSGNERDWDFEDIEFDLKKIHDDTFHVFIDDTNAEY